MVQEEKALTPFIALNQICRDAFVYTWRLFAFSLLQYFKPEFKLIRLANRGSKDTNDVHALRNNALMGLTTGVVLIIIAPGD